MLRLIYKFSCIIALLGILAFYTSYFILQFVGKENYSDPETQVFLFNSVPISIIGIIACIPLRVVLFIYKQRLEEFFNWLPIICTVVWLWIIVFDPGGVFYWFLGD